MGDAPAFLGRGLVRSGCAFTTPFFDGPLVFFWTAREVTFPTDPFDAGVLLLSARSLPVSALPRASLVLAVEALLLLVRGPAALFEAVRPTPAADTTSESTARRRLRFVVLRGWELDETIS